MVLTSFMLTFCRNTSNSRQKAFTNDHHPLLLVGIDPNYLLDSEFGPVFTGNCFGSAAGVSPHQWRLSYQWEE